MNAAGEQRPLVKVKAREKGCLEGHCALQRHQGALGRKWSFRVLCLSFYKQNPKAVVLSQFSSGCPKQGILCCSIALPFWSLWSCVTWRGKPVCGRAGAYSSPIFCMLMWALCSLVSEAAAWETHIGKCRQIDGICRTAATWKEYLSFCQCA